MSAPASGSSLGSQFDAFLFAPIGEEGNGMLLTVVSALARLELDPWAEAAALAKLPGKLAIARLTLLIDSLPGSLRAHLDSGAVSSRLIALLPNSGTKSVNDRKRLSRGQEPQPTQSTTYVVVVSAIILAGLIGSEALVAGQPPPTQTNHRRAPASGAAEASRIAASPPTRVN